MKKHDQYRFVQYRLSFVIYRRIQKQIKFQIIHYLSNFPLPRSLTRGSKFVSLKRFVHNPENVIDVYSRKISSQRWLWKKPYQYLQYHPTHDIGIRRYPNTTNWSNKYDCHFKHTMRSRHENSKIFYSGTNKRLLDSAISVSLPTRTISTTICFNIMFKNV